MAFMTDLARKSLTELWEQLGGSEGFERAHILSHLHIRSMEEGEFQDALVFAEQAAETFDELGNALDSLNSRIGIGHALQQIGRSEEAISVFLECIELSKAFPEGDNFGSIWESLGDTYTSCGEPGQAIISLIEAEGVNADDDELVGASRCAMKLGDTQAHQGLYSDAADSYLRGRKYLIGQNEALTIGALDDRISDTYLEMGRFYEAIDFAKQSLHIALTCPCKHCQPQAHYRLGNALLGAGRHLEAKVELELAETQFMQSESAGGQAKVWLSLARLKFELEDAESTDLLEQALTVLEALDWQQFVCEGKFLQAQMLASRGLTSEAAHLCARVENECIEAGANGLVLKARDLAAALGCSGATSHAD
jgi:tetratricopeptide (TPR) repeat protein